MRRWFVLTVWLAACRPEVVDDADLCLQPATDRIVARVSVGCASDHARAELSCEIEVEGQDIHVTSRFRDGRDPDTGCADPLTATCETDVLPEGTYTVRYADETFTVPVPSSMPVCAAGAGTGAAPDTGTGAGSGTDTTLHMSR